jgi:hypothetical protein
MSCAMALVATNNTARAIIFDTGAWPLHPDVSIRQAGSAAQIQ